MILPARISNKSKISKGCDWYRNHRSGGRWRKINDTDRLNLQIALTCVWAARDGSDGGCFSTICSSYSILYYKCWISCIRIWKLTSPAIWADASVWRDQLTPLHLTWIIPNEQERALWFTAYWIRVTEMTIRIVLMRHRLAPNTLFSVLLPRGGWGGSLATLHIKQNWDRDALSKSVSDIRAVVYHHGWARSSADCRAGHSGDLT